MENAILPCIHAVFQQFLRKLVIEISGFKSCRGHHQISPKVRQLQFSVLLRGNVGPVQFQMRNATLEITVRFEIRHLCLTVRVCLMACDYLLQNYSSIRY
jgi:hypothetical protein